MTRSDPLSRILVVGVGGQGVLIAARVIGNGARFASRPVYVGQIHGMSQRGGSVESTIVIGPNHTSFIGPGEADVVLGFEPLEALRALPRMNENTRVIINTQPIHLTTMSYRGESYPPIDSIVERISKVTPHVVLVDAVPLAKAAGQPRCMNVVMLGVLEGLGLLPYDAKYLDQATDHQSPSNFIDINRRALTLGQDFAERAGA